MKNLKLTPAHSIEANTWATALFSEWERSGIPFDVTCVASTPPTLKEVHEALSVTLGYASWAELIEHVSSPHEPIYITSENNAHEVLGERLSRYIKYNYSHGMVLNMLENAGVGYSPAERRAVLELTSPWGLIVEQRQLAEGIMDVKTAGHGGLKLTKELADAIPSHLTLNSEYYEEDEASALVYIAYPQLFPSVQDKANGLGRLSIFTSYSVPRKKTQAEIDFLAECKVSFDPELDLVFKPHVEDEELNRDLTEMEKHVIRYLSECVFSNKRPIAMPDTEYVPSLADWVERLNKLPRIDGTWKKTDMSWKEHFYTAPGLD